jgi:hypothetical protein
MDPYLFINIYFVKNNMDSNNYQNKSEKKEIVKTWLAGQYSCTLIIPKEFAKEYGLDKPSHVIVEGTSEGILIRKLVI